MKTVIISLSCLLANCTYKPVIDTAGRSGTFNEDKAKEITDDLHHCKLVADQNNTFWGGIVFDRSPTANTQHESYIENV